jgi:hypothetical protein
LIGYRQTIKQPKGCTTMKKSNVIELEGRDESQDPLTDMLRAGAQQPIKQAVEAELHSLLDQHAES